MSPSADKPVPRPYRMRTRAEGVERTRAAILEAALSIGDPREATIARVAERAGVSARTVLRHFGSKAELIRSAIELGSRLTEETYDDDDGSLDYRQSYTYDEQGNRLSDEGDSGADGSIEISWRFIYGCL